jgi:hypothetical protein
MNYQIVMKLYKIYIYLDIISYYFSIIIAYSTLNNYHRTVRIHSDFRAVHMTV